jgi:DNA-binding NtrC family response regulator
VNGLEHRLSLILFPRIVLCSVKGTQELSSRTIGRSQYIPFDPVKREFKANFKKLFMAVNLSALAPGLIESELFGHCQAAFNGAQSRTGRFAECDPSGVVFLDEVGEIHQEVQVKLLRVLQTREFEAVGTNDTVEFKGKLVAATNRNLLAEMQAGAFRSDLYFRLCADQIVTPSLSEQLQNNPKDLGNLVLFIVRDVLGDEGDDVSPEAFQLGEEATKWIHEKIPQDYAWSGNVRELGHCVRSFILRREYRLLDIVPGGSPAWELARAVESGLLTANELEQRYYHLVYTQAGSYQEAGRRLGVNWRTVRTKIRESIKRVGG